MAILTAKDKAEMAERAAERRKLNAEAVRERIQAAQLIDVLQNHALGKGRMKMTMSRLKSIELLLDKSVPDIATQKIDVTAKQVVFNLTTQYTPQPAPLPVVEEGKDG